MNEVPFIFSNERKYRLARHISYWLFWWIFQGILYSFTPASVRYDPSVRFLSSFLDSLIYMSGHIILSYSLMYYVIPKFLLQQRYLLTALLAITLFLGTAFLNAVLAQTIIAPLHVKLGVVGRDQAFFHVNYLTILAGLRGGITVCGISCAIKLMKYWSLKEKRNLQLQKENLESKLELLKSQIHPHFLFNTLNNLYSLTLTQAKEAPTVVTHLSDLLRYILYECNEKTVPLKKELEALKKYVELEKIRYGNRIDVSFVYSGEVEKVWIAPLLFLPFVENSFKHGTSKMLDQCWVNLNIHAGKDSISFNLINSVSEQKGGETAGGIGLENVKNRLALLYPDSYELSISQAEEIFNVRLLIKIPAEATSRVYPAIEPSLIYKPATSL